jgi:hypothetical protein
LSGISLKIQSTLGSEIQIEHSLNGIDGKGTLRPAGPNSEPKKVMGGAALRSAFGARGRPAIMGYVLVIAAANLIWEAAQLPLYTIWLTATAIELTFAVLHCTAGDVLIGSASLLAALSLVGNRDWPKESRGRVTALTIGFAVAFTIFSEWFNVEVRRSWAYAPAMPLIPPLGTGLAPLLQWIMIPLLALGTAYRPWGTKR